MIGAYFQLQSLSELVRGKHKIRSKQRLDCTNFTKGIDYRGLTKFVNHKGQMYFYISPARDVVKADSKRQADICLTNGDNLSSLFFEDLEYKQFAFGDFGNDGLLFIVNEDYSRIEILVIPNGKNLIKGYYQKLLYGDFDEVIQRMREQAKPFYNY